jgi:hypothetical protein
MTGVGVGVLVNVAAVVAFLGVIIAAVVLGVRVRGEGRSDPPAFGHSGFARAGHLAASPRPRNDIGEDDLYRRLM